MAGKKAGARRGLIRQGDVLLVPIAQIPEDARKGPDGAVVLALGEATGHAHRIDDPRAQSWARGPDERFVLIDGDDPVALVHEEHDTLDVPPGAWRIQRQREFEPTIRRPRWVAD